MLSYRNWLRGALASLLLSGVVPAVRLGAQDTTRVDTTARKLAEVSVAATAESVELRKAGFYERARIGWGQFLHPKDVDGRRHLLPSSMIQDFRGIRVRCPAVGPCIITGTAGACMSIVVDGIAQPGVPLDARVSSNMIYAVEVYSTAGRVPVEIKRHFTELACGAIVVWTQPRYGGDPGRRFTRGRLARLGVAAIILAIALF